MKGESTSIADPGTPTFRAAFLPRRHGMWLAFILLPSRSVTSDSGSRSEGGGPGRGPGGGLSKGDRRPLCFR